MHPYRAQDPSTGPQGHFIALTAVRHSYRATSPEHLRERSDPPPKPLRGGSGAPTEPTGWGWIPPAPPTHWGGGVLGAEEEPLVPLVHLLEKDEGEHGVGAQAGIVGGEALPEAEEALIPHHLQQHILGGGEEQSSMSGGPPK